MEEKELIKTLKDKYKWSETQIRLGLRAKFKCEYCGKDLLKNIDDYKLWQVDHIRPKSKQGNDDCNIDDCNNLAISCRQCNVNFKSNYFPMNKNTENMSRQELIDVFKKYIIERRRNASMELSEMRDIIGKLKKITGNE